MRKFVPVLAAVFVMALVAPAFAAPAPKATGGVGFLGFDNTPRNAQFNAHEAKDGRPAKGMLRQTRPDTGDHFVVDVTCVDVDGIEAFFGGVVTQGTGAFASRVGQGIYATAEDNGEPGAAGDEFRPLFVASEAVACAMVASQTPLARFMVTSGNLQVHD